ncbi:MAG: phosphomannomutase/phosphoglucomutase, partial [Phycisphaerae bacterium]|nr:phosphomannomutase/phosphoglucomutase [Phycisphaerae bacterium]
HADGKIDFLDGITVVYKDWWFNVRKSNTEPLVRLNLEAKTEKVRDEKFEELKSILGTPRE